MAPRLARLPLLALAAGAASAGATLLRRGAREPASPLGEGSKLIEGEDCGRAKVLVPKYGHAAKVGEVAGRARGAITAATAIKEVAAVDIAKGKDASKAIGGDATIDTAVTEAEDASTAVTKATGNLETELGTFKSKVSGSEFSGADVTQDEISSLRKNTEEVQKAAKALSEKTLRLQEKIVAAVEKSKAHSADAGSAAKALIADGEAKIKEAKDMSQKAGWAEKDADTLVAEANTAATDIQAKADSSAEQKPVWEALKSDIEGQVAGVEQLKGDVATAKTTLDGTLTPLADALKPLETVVQDADAGKAVSSATLTEDTLAAEKARDATADAMQALTDKMAALDKAMESLKKTMADAKTKMNP